MPWHAVPVLAKKTLNRSALSSSIAPGSTLDVSSVHVKKDRVELVLRGEDPTLPAILRLWFDKGFAQSTDAQSVLRSLSPYVGIGGALGERLRRLEESRLFVVVAQQAELDFRAEALSDADRLERGASYLSLLEEELENREALARLSGEAVETSDVEAARATVEAEIETLSISLNGPRLQELRTELDSVASAITALRASLAEDGTLLGEQLDRWEVSLQSWPLLAEEYATLHGSGSRDELEAVAASRAELDNRKAQLSARLEEERRTQALENEERAAASSRSILESLGSQVAGSPSDLHQQENELSRYQQLLAERRQLLVGLDSSAPDAVVSRLEADEAALGALEQLVASGRQALRGPLLEEEYLALTKTRQKLDDEYTLAYGASGQKDAALRERSFGSATFGIIWFTPGAGSLALRSERLSFSSGDWTIALSAGSLESRGVRYKILLVHRDLKPGNEALRVPFGFATGGGGCSYRN